MKCMSGQPCFLHTCSGLRFLASQATNPEHRDASVLLGASKFVVDFLDIVTVSQMLENFGEIQI